MSTELGKTGIGTRRVRGMVTLALSAALALGGLSGSPAVASVDDPGLASTPYMGWNTYYGLGGDFTEAEVLDVAQALKDRGLHAVGYDIVWLDGGWAEADRDADGNLVASRDRFPSGLKHLTDELHAMGLRAGIYTDAGEHRPTSKSCTIGSGGHQQRDADQFAEWGFDAVKVDFLCGYDNKEDPETAFRAMAAAIRNNALGRPMVFNLCNPISPEWGTFPAEMMSTHSWTYAPEIAESWRTYTDVGFGGKIEYVNVLRNYDANARHPEAAGPGHWNDPDYLGPELGMTDTEFRTQMSLWTIAAAPLIIGSDVRTLSETSIATLTDPEVIAISQDELGQQARRVSPAGAQEVWVKELSDGSRAVALLNRSNSPAQISTTLEAIGIDANSADVRDVWAHATTTTVGTIRGTVEGHGTTLLRVTAPATAGNPPRVVVGEAAVTAVDGQSLARPTTDVLAPAGSRLDLQVRVENDGATAAAGLTLAVAAPEGWEVTGATDVPAVAPDGNALMSFRVTVPTDAAHGASTISFTPQRDGETVGAPAVVSVVVAPPAPEETTNLAHHPWVSGTSGWMTPTIDQSVGNGGALRIEGVTYKTGIGVASPSEIRYYLGARCSRLTGFAGVDELVKDINAQGGTVTFHVVGDGVTLFETDVVVRDETVPLDVDVTGVNDLRLIVGIGPDHTYNDRADWVDLEVTCQPLPEPTDSPSPEPTDTTSPEPTDSPSPEPTDSGSQGPAPSPGPTVTVTPRPTTPRAPYEVPGFHNLNGRWWYTTCEPYSQTIRCRTDIWARQVVAVNGRFQVRAGWFFNNLTYLPAMTRAQWAANPLGHPGSWTTGGRQWRTECDTPATGRGACRSYILATVVEARPAGAGRYTFHQLEKWVFNNLVRFRD